MRRADSCAADGWWLAFGGVLLLAACHLAALRGAPGGRVGPLLIVGSVVGFCGLAVGIHRGNRQVAERARRGQPPAQPVAGPGPRPLGDEIARRMVASFLAWLEEQGREQVNWRSFDQLLRELLSEHLSATRVRCYRLVAGSQELRSLSQPGRSRPADEPGRRGGILGHVAATGREFLAGDPAHGRLVDELAQESGENWDWVWPVRAFGGHGQPVGLVAVGRLPSGSQVDRARCRVIGPLLSLFWEHVATLEQLAIAQRTDKASGVLTRADFFERAGRALADSYEQNEPVVVAVLALEGVRRLDDVGRWEQRDGLVETLGQLIARRVRSDDVVGRFSDDRFVIVLRRIDSGLGRLITEKVVAAMQQRIARLEDACGPIRVRAGLAGSGLQRPSLPTLLVGAAAAVQRARQQDAALCAEVAPAELERVE